MTDASPLAGRTALVTGVSRRAGIGFAIARRLLSDGARVMAQSWAPHDEQQSWGADPDGVEGVLAGLRDVAPDVEHVALDLGAPDAPARLVDAAVGRLGSLDVLVAAHARSTHAGLDEVTAAELDAAWAVNARATVLLVQAMARRRAPARPPGRAILFTSGQHKGPMEGELAYAISKGAVHQATASLAAAVADLGVTVNAINPGPVDTGWPDDALRAELAARFPAGRMGRPDDIAGVVAWLAGDDSGWLTGQVLDVEGGFRR